MKPSLRPLSKQTGEIKFWHVLLIVLVVVSFALFINAKGTGFFTHTLPQSFGFTKTTNNNNDNDQTNYSQPQVSNANYYREPEDTDPDIWVNEPTSPQQQPIPQIQAVEEYNDNLYETSQLPKPSYSYDEQFPPRLGRGYYTVQVFTGYNSKLAYELRTALKKDGYTATHIRELRTRKGVLFKVRIGRYKERYAAFAVRDQLRRRYPKSLNTSFVMLVEFAYN